MGFYSHLPDSDIAQYYTFEMGEGDRLKLSLTVPRNQDFIPDMILIGPAIEMDGDVPEYIDIPENKGAWLIRGETPEKGSYEPFTPSKYYNVVDIDTVAPSAGKYHVVIYSDKNGGEYAFVIGYLESFTIVEWITVPGYAIGIHLWEGQSIFFILAPLIITLLTGLSIVFNKGKNLSFFAITGITAGLFYIGSAAMNLYQMIIAMMGTDAGFLVIVTLVLIAISVLMGLLLIKISLQDHVGNKERLSMALVSVAGLFTWSGILIGPLIALATVIFPGRQQMN